MSGDDIPASLAEAMAEIRRLRGQAATMRHPSGEARLNTYVPPEYVAVEKTQFHEMAAEIERLKARIEELLELKAMVFGTLEQPTPDEPAAYTHNVPPSAPPHDE